MNIQQRRAWLGAAFLLAVSACSTDSNRYNNSSTDSTTDGSTLNSTSSGTTSSSGTGTGMGSGGSAGNTSATETNNGMAGGTAGMGDQPRSSAQSAQSTPGTPNVPGMTPSSNVAASYGAVQAIDQMQRQDISAGTIGAAAAGGGIGAPTDKVYRITVHLDDGSNQMVVVDAMPNYKIGDRVRYSNGVVERY
ncbi:hypothetical protein ACFOLJ_02630 [Rugamonas sp. CCM 8940]|uniref:hypothetical protein n=1 Tax=Rugamonas sp. CCM 8940 TaxID=2765359 RepID=UPI0018F459AF|nr:hypothetical protein [Rugamonas sp. CCM 8940]MBJ7311838.1 hypothetical protein [Rugamonas sp. CCM 8940]